MFKQHIDHCFHLLKMSNSTASLLSTGTIGRMQKDDCCHALCDTVFVQAVNYLCLSFLALSHSKPSPEHFVNTLQRRIVWDYFLVKESSTLEIFQRATLQNVFQKTIPVTSCCFTISVNEALKDMFSPDSTIYNTLRFVFLAC